MKNKQTKTTPSTHPTRRKLIKATAWTAPTLVVASLPLHAETSPTPTPPTGMANFGSSGTGADATAGGHDFIVPAGVTSITVTYIGGSGGGGAGGNSGRDDTGGAGGQGAGGEELTATLAVTPNATLTVTVGAAGAAGLQPSALAPDGGEAGGNGGDTLVPGLTNTLGGTGGGGAGSNNGATELGSQTGGDGDNGSVDGAGGTFFPILIAGGTGPERTAARGGSAAAGGFLGADTGGAGGAGGVSTPNPPNLGMDGTPGTIGSIAISW